MMPAGVLTGSPKVTVLLNPVFSPLKRSLSILTELPLISASKLVPPLKGSRKLAWMGLSSKSDTGVKR